MYADQGSAESPLCTTKHFLICVCYYVQMSMIKTKNITFLVAIAVKLIDNALCLDWFKKAFYGPAHVSMWKSLK